MTKATHYTNINPAEWGTLGWFYIGDSTDLINVYKEDHRELNRYLATYGTDLNSLLDNQGDKIGRCDSCSSAYSHGTVVMNSLTSQILLVGHICGTDHFGASSIAEQRQRSARKVAARRAEELARQAKAVAYLQANQWVSEIIVEATSWEDCWAKSVVEDMAEGLYKWGSLTPKQEDFLGSLPGKYTADQKVKAAQPEPSAVLEGTQEITGIVLTEKFQDSMYGTQHKMLVLDDRGFKVWGTVPSAIGQAITRGDRVTFTANVEVSDKDFDFGFFKRPRKAQILATV